MVGSRRKLISTPSIGAPVCPARVATSEATVVVAPAIDAEPPTNPSWSHLRHVFSKASAAVGTAAAVVAGFAVEPAAGLEPEPATVGTAGTPEPFGAFVCQYSLTTSYP